MSKRVEDALQPFVVVVLFFVAMAGVVWSTSWSIEECRAQGGSDGYCRARALWCVR